MHNLHYIVVNAESGQDACDIVETQISEWGNENNWRTIGGAVASDNEVYRVPVKDSWGNSRWTPEENHTIDMINEQVEKWLEPDQYTKDQFNKCVEGDIGSPYDWYGAKKYCKHMYEFTQTKHFMKEGKFDVLQNSFFEWSLDECGVTHIDISQIEDDDPTLKQYVVFVDMHS